MNDAKQTDKMMKYSKIEYITKKWNVEKVSKKELKNYNAWTASELQKVINAEFFLEHYLTVNIYNDIAVPNDIFLKPNEYFSNKQISAVIKEKHPNNLFGCLFIFQ